MEEKIRRKEEEIKSLAMEKLQEEQNTTPLVEHRYKTIKESKLEKLMTYLSRACLILALLSMLSYGIQCHFNPYRELTHAALLGLSFTFFLALLWFISADPNDDEEYEVESQSYAALFITAKYEVWIRRFGTVCLFTSLFIITGEVKYLIMTGYNYEFFDFLHLNLLICLILLATWAIIYRIYGRRICPRCARRNKKCVATVSDRDMNLCENCHEILHV